MTEDGRKHLEFCQQVINRMGNNSFALKGWSVTLLAAIFALAADKAKVSTIWVAILPVLVFWVLDAYFLGQERLYRSLYNQLRKLDNAQWEVLGERRYSLTPSDFNLQSESLRAVMQRATVAALYGALLASVVIFALILHVLRNCV
jgi:hypothetical protein